MPKKDINGKWQGKWFGSGGKARCDLCNIVFDITMAEDNADEAEAEL
jgi:hypothetical protein